MLIASGMRINIRQIEAFRAVYSTGSMTLAGELMGVTQPAVSRLIRDLEAAVGFLLFERRGNRLTTTADAAALYREVERSFRGIDSIAAAAAALRGRREGDLRIAASFAPSFYCLPPAIAAFRAAWPGVKPTLRTRSSPEVLNLVALHQCDLGVAAVPAGVAGVDIETLAVLDVVCVLPAGHSLARHKVVRPEHLAAAPMFMIGEPSPLQQRIGKVFEAAGIRPRVVFESSYSGPICALVAQGRGVAVLEPLTAYAHRHLGLVFRPFEPVIQYELQAIYPAGQPREERTKAFVAHLRDDLRTIEAGAV